MTAFGASAVAGVPLGLLLAGVAGWRLPFLFVALLATAVWLLLWKHLPATPVTAAPTGVKRPRLADILQR